MPNGRLKIPKPTWIVSNDELALACGRWQSEAFLALDTEFVRTKTFFPIPGLIQVADSAGCYLIDPQKITDWSAFVEILKHPLVIKVLHACAEDLDVFKRLMDCVPSPLCDTQLACGFVGLGPTLGFQGMVKAILNISIDKEETLSDWLKRPLSVGQVQYATADVHYLYRAYPKLLNQLSTLGRVKWLLEDCERLVSAAQVPENPAKLYLRIKQGWMLKLQDQFVLQQLAIWRERLAHSQDVPRARIANDEMLLKLARFKPDTKDDIKRVHGLNRLSDPVLDGLLECLQQAKDVKSQHWPKPLPKPLSKHASETYKHIKRIVRDKAEHLDIPAEYLARKKQLEDLLRSGLSNGRYTLPPGLQGWRKAAIGDYLLAILTEQTE